MTLSNTGLYMYVILEINLAVSLLTFSEIDPDIHRAYQYYFPKA